jgi:hypothetical protein
MALDHKPTRLEYQRLYASFENQVLDPMDLPMIVASGLSFGNCSREPRSSETWTMAQYVGVDLEKHKAAMLEKATAHPFYQAYGFMGYTTMSHQWDEPRCRLIFLLEEPVDDREMWHWGAKAISEMFFPAVDASSADRGRAFLGNPNAEIVVNGRYLSNTTFSLLSGERRRKHDNSLIRPLSGKSSHDFSSTPVLATLGRWCEKIRLAPEGQRNNALNRCAFMAGRYLVDKGSSDLILRTALIEAGVAAGLSSEEATKTVNSAFARGRHTA